MTLKPQIHQAPDALHLAIELAEFVALRLREGIHQRGHALLVVSGGSTPVPFWDALAQCSLDWARVTVTLADERWLPPAHADSNERLVRAHLLQGPAAQARFQPLFNGEVTPGQAQAAVEIELARLPWPADVVILGMGGDGHTASLFPYAPELPQALSQSPDALRCLAVGAPLVPNVPVPRLTLTRRALLDARVLIIHVTGASKVALLQKAWQGASQEASQAESLAELPIRLALQPTNLMPLHVFQTV